MSPTSSERVEIRFPGDARYLPAIRDLVAEFLSEPEAATAVDDVSTILLAVQEACVNAIKHGHGGDPTLPVELVVVNHDDRVELRIRDGGSGFTLPEEPIFATNPTAESGRGLAIMQAVMDEVSVTSDEGQTVLSLIKRKGDG